MIGKFLHGDFLSFVYDFYNIMRDNEISLAYEGEINQMVTKAFTSLAEGNMEVESEDGHVQRKVFHVMVECLQNISKHADRVGQAKEGRGIFIVSKGDVEYHVVTGNIIDNDKIEPLKNSLDNVNSLDKDGLKELYKKQMKVGTLSDKGGAGLGFIDMVRKTGNKLQYHFLPVDEKYSFFMLVSTISRNENKENNN
ncbi:MAG: hypothetical protein HY958_07145 [Bacteroidia bacterium]|nr:hypothetical protein [Bacteroidia bacterium]